MARRKGGDVRVRRVHQRLIHASPTTPAQARVRSSRTLESGCLQAAAFVGGVVGDFDQAAALKRLQRRGHSGAAHRQQAGNHASWPLAEDD